MTVRLISTCKYSTDKHGQKIVEVELGGGVRIHVIIAGDDTANDDLLLLPGCGGAPDLYAPEELAARLGVRVIAFWLPGHGRSSDLRTYAEFMECFPELAKELGIKPDALWVGHSMGAFLALGLAIEHDGLITRVLAVAPPLGPPHDRRPIDGLPSMMFYLWAEALAISSVTTLRNLYYRDPRLLQAWNRVMFVQPFRYPETVGVMNSSPDLLPQLGALARRLGKENVVCIFGQFDMVVPPQQLPCTTYIVPGGHNFLLALGGRSYEEFLLHAADMLGVTPAPAPARTPAPEITDAMAGLGLAVLDATLGATLDVMNAYAAYFKRFFPTH